MSPAAEEPDATRGERREEKRRKKKRAMRLHGASLRRIYRDAILKRARRIRDRTDDSSEPPDGP